MLIPIIKKLKFFLKVLIQKLNSDRLTRFLITSLLTLIFTINFSGISLWLPAPVRSEGSFQFGVSPTTTLNQQGLIEYDSPYTDGGGGTTGIGILRRPIFVDIQSANERINISACGNAFADDWKADIYYVGPQPPIDNNSYTGTYAAYPPASGTLLFTGGTNANGTIGTLANNPNCNNNSQLTSGTMTYPVSVLASSGPGVYEIRLQNLTQNANAAAPLTLFRQFDISVTNSTTPTVKIPAAPNPQIAQGRVWSYVWAFNAGGFAVANSTNQDYYVVVPGGVPGTNYVWQLDLNQFAGYVYELVANNRGVDSPNAATQNVRGLSVPISGNSVSPQYRMYLTYPDQTFTKPTVGPTISNLRFEDSAGEDNTFTPGGTGGIQDTGFFRFTSSLPGTYQIIIDTNNDGVFGDASGLDVQLRGDTDAVGNVSALWNGRNNAGAVLPVGTYNAQVKAIVGEYHFIAGDVETSGPGSGLTINEATSPSTTATTPVYWDDKTILGAAGTTTLPNGIVGGRHTWGTTSSGGAQGSNGSSWGDLRYLDTFVYGSFSVGTIPAIISDGDDNDYGDAPDTYGTDRTNSATEGVGASHILSTTIRLGTAVTDKDTNGQPNAAANGDDTNGVAPDDEDGVTSFNSLRTTDTTYTVSIRVQNTSGANAYLAGWIDFNRNGSFEAGEGVVQPTPIATGTNGNVNINWTGLGALGLTEGNTYARFRINNDPLTTSDFIGGKRNGEVEDYALTIIGATSPLDYGDAPDATVGVGIGNYNTTSADSGASHLINTNLRLGNTPDADNGTLQSVAADADDSTNTGVANDEDGVTLPTPNTLTTASTSYSATVNVTNSIGTPATLVGWIDFDKDGLFEATEAQTATVADNSNGTNVILTWSGLSGLTAGNTYARFRISNGTLTTSTPTGLIGSGEVEDYLVTINPVDYGDAPDADAAVTTGNYQTTSANGGASHIIVNTLRIGANIDADNGTLQNANADLDDTTGIDDEDGVALPAITASTTSYTATVNVTNTAAPAYLVGWIDFNRNGQFEVTEGRAYDSDLGTAGIQPIAISPTAQDLPLQWTGISGLTAGDILYAHFRLSDSATLTTATPDGLIGNGEVEDYQLVVTNAIDYGDAPDTGVGIGQGNYETLSASGGASHTIIANLRLGTIDPDADSGLLQNVTANADDTNGVDDEDGVATFPALTTSSTSYSVTVDVFNNTGVNRPLVGWVDFNRNGNFEATEAQTASVPSSAIVQNITLNWTGITVPTAGNTYARFRISDGALTTATPNGAVGNGEVEDYPITITNAGVAGLNLVKRITAINNTAITGFVDGANTATSNDNDPNWPTANAQYLRGAIDCTTASPCNGGTISSVAPGGLIEYTIYFLSNGANPARNVQLCDRLPADTVFQPDTYGSGNGILLGWNTTGGALPLPDPTNSTIGAGKVALNNVPDADAGQFLATNVSVTNAPAPCNNGATNPEGAILVRLGAVTDVPNATGSGTPTNSYGFIRFQARVK
jgi:uncharacterized repeat protein (TIGR01451 family)